MARVTVRVGVTIKLCTRPTCTPKSAVWTCRTCAAHCCGHLCSDKNSGDKSTTCNRCRMISAGSFKPQAGVKP